MEAVTFRYSSKRAQEARIGKKFTKLLRVGLLVVSASLFGLGLGLLFIQLSVGWLVVGFSSLGLVFYLWWRLHLSRLEPGKSSAIDSIIEGDVLGHLPQNLSPQDIGTATLQVSGGRFFAARFGLGPVFLTELALSLIHI